jgi:pyrroloquinoline quinone biosynthesis protein B
MRVALLGTAAGGAFPQWNCHCGNCRVARGGSGRAIKRTQSCIAVSADEKRWFLVNASPDVGMQIESFPPLLSPGGVNAGGVNAGGAIRGSAIAGILLTNADLDHTLGLFRLREGSKLIVHATNPVRQSLAGGLNVEAVLNCYCGVEWREPPRELLPLRDGGGRGSGLQYAAFDVPGKPPRYRAGISHASGEAVGYRIVDESSGGRLVVIPDLAGFDETVLREIAGADILLLDGTFFSEDEMRRSGAGTALACEMGHVPVGGADGSLAQIEKFRDITRVYVHINNTNPMLLEDSPERGQVEAAGAIVGADGMQFNC